MRFPYLFSPSVGSKTNARSSIGSDVLFLNRIFSASRFFFFVESNWRELSTDTAMDSSSNRSKESAKPFILSRILSSSLTSRNSLNELIKCSVSITRPTTNSRSSLLFPDFSLIFLLSQSPAL